jgi:hypothetical protein
MSLYQGCGYITSIFFRFSNLFIYDWGYIGGAIFAEVFTVG